jgi:archaellum component FlaC
MAAVRLFKEAQAAKAKAKEQKDIELFNKRLDQIDNILQRIDKAFGTLDKYLADVAVLRLSLGDNVSNLNKLSGDS